MKKINKTYWLDLDFIESKNEFSFPPFAQVILKCFSKDERGNIIITNKCVNIKEFNYNIDQLIDELEIIRKEAKLKFTKS